jgi:hypothetical protein
MEAVSLEQGRAVEPGSAVGAAQRAALAKRGVVSLPVAESVAGTTA